MGSKPRPLHSNNQRKQRHKEFYIDWPNSPWLVSGAVLGDLLSIWAAGELFFKKKTSQDLTV
jgi:hypothetical protein